MPTPSLNGRELASFIKQRQARQVRHLRQAHGITPKLLIITPLDASGPINAYVRYKQAYAADILVETEVAPTAETDMPGAIDQANNDPHIHGIIVQLPLNDPSQTDAIVQRISPAKDVDGLSGPQAAYTPATAQAIDWLLAGYNISLDNKQLAIIGRGRLVGAPLERLWRDRGLTVTVCDRQTPNTTEIIAASDVIVTATGQPHLITADMVKTGAVVVDAGTASEGGVIVGDVDPSLRERSDVTLTPEKGGVGPLTIAVMIDHVIQAAQATIESREE